ncbi:thiamine-phosphate kinase [Roseibium hamelinense]|uniref:Thiamine-monophosphate kinase n=1 Tax=Roseibium hamelinense TaxID=150831 RepID=A0A562TGA7_9HYPH|nr:thiamine-phosphate kinase [Roseibium hamelinense]MTI46191.1 thiamine-phosphate kinase [Roseibium hamelinense]TWI92617.1 thiamine-phosphate kinase [Roseibium hamelinense]
MAVERPGEFELIKTYFAPLAHHPGSAGLTDDAAVLEPSPGMDLVLTKDILAADVHFFAEDPPEAIAAKALRVNLSDLAAKGAAARGYLLGIALHRDWTAEWMQRFCCGLSADQAAFDLVLYGGDTIRSGNGLQVSITAIGEVPTNRAVRRSGASNGDALFVSGTIGDAAAGLKVRLDKGFSSRGGFSSAQADHVLNRYLLPQPRTRLAPVVAEYASASMDVSDGLLADAGHLSAASNVDIEIRLDQVPLSPAMHQLRKADFAAFLGCLNGGDDYEILAAVPAEKADAFRLAAEAAQCPVSRIGKVREGSGQVVLLDDGVPVDATGPKGFLHF